jgi:hypothetical protein
MLSPLSPTNHTIGGGFTGLHQDGHGTVDSGHTVMQGHNEVFMLPRLQESGKIQVCDILLGGDGQNQSKVGEKALYCLPHDEVGSIQTAQWPTVEMIQKLEDLGYVAKRQRSVMTPIASSNSPIT